MSVAAGASLESEIVPTDCGPVELARVGAGPPVVLVHGIPGSWRQAVPLARDLADRHTVLLPSRPGYGRTPISSGRSPDEQADLYAAMLDALGFVEASAIVGISGGGPSALAFAQRHPERCASLTLACAVASHLIEVPRAMLLGASLPPLAHAVSAVARRRQRALLADRARVDARISHDLTADERARMAADPSIRDDLEAFLHSHADAPPGIAGLANDARQLRLARQTGAAPVERITCPTLVLHGDSDTVVPLSHAQHHAAAIPHARLEIFSGAGHVFLFTRRSETTAAIRSHLVSETR